MKTIVAIAGKAGHGKTTLATMLDSLLAGEAIIMNLADPLKVAVQEWWDFAPSALYGPSQARESLHPVYGVSARTVLQTLGQSMRDLHPDVWVNLFLKRAEQQQRSVVICGDVRYRNERARIKDAGGMVVRVRRAEAPPRSDLHPSEVDLDEVPDDWFDHVFDTPTMEDVRAWVESVLVLNTVLTRVNTRREIHRS